MIHLYNRLLRRIPRVPLPGRRQMVEVKLKRHQEPFLVRLGSTDMLVLEEMFQTGEYTFVEEGLRNVRRIVDLGANVGFSLRYWHEAFPEAKILAVEPDADNLNTCRRNVEAGKFSKQVTLVQACVGSHRRQVRLGGAEEWAYQMIDGGAGQGVTLEVLPLSELLETYAPAETIDLLKCDIEGAERELFADCRSWISRVKAIVVELHPPYSSADFISDLNRNGARFEVVRHFSEKQCPVLLLRSTAS